jgi:hypothetical protein
MMALAEMDIMNTASLIQRILSNFLLLTLVYFGLNWIEN